MPDTATVNRCRRCGTRLTAQRRACPSCGLDVPIDRTEVLPVDAGGEVYANVGKAPRRAEAKKGVSICPVCMNSAPVDTMSDHGGQMLCADCHEKMSKKGTKGPPPEQPPAG